MVRYEVIINGKSLHLPEDWKEILGDDVVQKRRTINSRLKEIGISKVTLKKYVTDPEFLALAERYSQSQAHANSVDKEEHRRKTLEANLKRFGTTSPMKVKEIHDKVISTNLKRYGTNSPASTAKVQQKMKDTCNAIYGADNVLQNAEIKKKAQEKLQDWVNTTTREERIKLSADAYKEKTGFDNPSLNPKVKAKREETLKSRYGAKSIFGVESFRRKIEENRLLTLGVKYANALTKEQMISRLKQAYGIELLEDIESFSESREIKAKCTVCGHEFLFHFNKCVPTSCPYCNNNSTILERQIVRFIESKGFKTIPHYRVLNNKEVDIFIPSLNIGFEINGAYTHNSGYDPFRNRIKSPNYHKSKTDLAASRGILLYHIWEHWNKDVIYSIISAKLRSFDFTYQARKLSLTIENDQTAIYEFLERTHIQGYCSASISFALKDDKEIIQILQFTIQDDTALLVRNASKLNSQIIGGFNKLMKYAIVTLKKKGVNTIITYANRDLTPNSEQSVYFRSNFEFKGDTGLTLGYFVSKPVKLDSETLIPCGVYNRQKFMKSKLQALNGCTSIDGIFEFDPNLTEQENLAKLQIYPVYNSGCYKYELHI